MIYSSIYEQLGGIMRKDKKYTLLWGEHVDIKSFLIGLLIQVIILIPTLLIVKNEDLKLVFGLVAIVVGLIINAYWIKPKRNVEVKEKDDNND